MPILDKIAFSNLSIMKIWYDDNEMKEILGNQEKNEITFATMNIFLLYQNLNLKLLQTQVLNEVTIGNLL